MSGRTSIGLMDKSEITEIWPYSMLEGHPSSGLRQVDQACQ